jgi:hypothetical protein
LRKQVSQLPSEIAWLPCDGGLAEPGSAPGLCASEVSDVAREFPVFRVFEAIRDNAQ